MGSGARSSWRHIGEGIRRFRQSYAATLGAPTRDDRLYETVSEGRRYPGMEHWLPLFHDHLDTLIEYVPDIPVVFDALADDAEKLAKGLLLERLEKSLDRRRRYSPLAGDHQGNHPVQ